MIFGSSFGARFFLRRALAIGLLGGIAACSSGDGDPPSVSQPDPLGNGKRVREVVDPALKTTGNVYITGAEVVAVDTFDETKDGKSNTSVYVQDANSTAPYSGALLYKPAYVPADLRVASGDVLDLRGPYEEFGKLGSAVFDPGKVLPEISTPTATFRYETAPATPTAIDVNDLNDYTKGRKWLNMLVTVKDVTLVTAPTAETSKGVLTGRVTAQLISGGQDVPEMSNELFDVQPGSIPAGTKLKSLTGVVTWFFSFHIAPRSQADIVQ